MRAMTADDFLFTAEDGAWLSREELLTRMRQHRPRTCAMHMEVELRQYGPVALVQGVFQAQADPATQRLRFTDVWLWTGRGWQLVSVQNTALQEGVLAQQHKGDARRRNGSAYSTSKVDDQLQLTELNAQYVQAFREADVAWYETHLAPDYTVVPVNGKFEYRAAAMTDVGVPYFVTSMRSFPVDKVRVRRFADVALIHAENDYVLKDGRQGVSRYTDIWHKTAGMWRCVAAHITVYKAPA